LRRRLRRGIRLGDGPRRIEGLDGGHAHVARRLQVDAEVVEIDVSSRIEAKRPD
jgi:hypothetical protein